MQEKFAIVGLGYVGLQVALGFARAFEDVVGFDVDASKVEELSRGFDKNREVPEAELSRTRLRITSDPSELRGRTFYVIAVPSPVDEHHVPDLSAIVRASETVGAHLAEGAVVVYESTVYPGVTEDVCGPILADKSGLSRGQFHLGYSPERINPGDREHTLERVVKVVAGDDDATLERVADAYGAVVRAGTHRAPSIRVAEAAKVIENTQRDLNIALMNELALIFDRMGIRTRDVLEAAATKWNFLRFSPGLVGGHCIGVDPYYLTTKARQLGYEPEVILAGRRINDTMGAFVAQRLVKLLLHAGLSVRGARVGVLGITFKENVNDLRNSRVPDILRELADFGIAARVHDPYACRADAKKEYNLALTAFEEMVGLDALVLAVPHRAYLDMGEERLSESVRSGGVLIDVRSALDPSRLRSDIVSWSL